MSRLDVAGLFERHAQAIYGYCFRRTADAALAEDLTSIVFLEAWRRRDVELTEASALPWLYGVATNVLRNQRRSLRRHRVALGRLGAEQPEPDFAEAVADRLAAETEMRSILELVERLPRLEREVLALCAWQGLTPHQAALALGVPEATARTRLFRARSRLRASSENLAPEGVELS